MWLALFSPTCTADSGPTAGHLEALINTAFCTARLVALIFACVDSRLACSAILSHCLLTVGRYVELSCSVGRPEAQLTT